MKSEKIKEFQKHLVEKLSNPELDKDLLKASSSSIAESYGRGIKWDDTFPIGIKNPDAIRVEGRIPLGYMGRLKDLMENKYLIKIEVFPHGIINPEYLKVNATFSNNRHLRINR